MFRSLVRALICLLAIPCALRAAGTAPALVSIDDFEDGDLIAAPGSAWVPIGDDLMGGKTNFRLDATRGGAKPWIAAQAGRQGQSFARICLNDFACLVLRCGPPL